MASIFKPRRRDSKTGKVKVGRYWWGQYRLDSDPKVTRLSLKTTDKRVAEKRLAEIIIKEERCRAGLIPDEQQAVAASTPIADHLDAFVEYQTKRKLKREYVRKLRQRIGRLIKECGWKRLRDVAPDSFIAWRHDQALSPKTLNDYLDAISGLMAWLARTGRVERNPLEHVERVDRTGGETFKRRAFTDGEAVRLLRVHHGRRAIYLMALHTGLRKSELHDLLWQDIDLDHGLIRLRAEATKAKREDVLPITPAVHDQLSVMSQDANLAGLVFPGGVPSHHTFRRDLDSAGIPRVDHRGHKVDFHALRTTYITNLQRAGASQRVTMALARHRDPSLTANIYTDVEALPLAESVAELPAYGHTESALQTAHEPVTDSHGVTRNDTVGGSRADSHYTAETADTGAMTRQSVTRHDTHEKWSRGESNPRPAAVHATLLRAHPTKSLGVRQLVGQQTDAQPG